MNKRTTRSTIRFDPNGQRALRLEAALTSPSMSEDGNDAGQVAFLEDQVALAAFGKRAREPTLSYDELLAKLKACL